MKKSYILILIILFALIITGLWVLKSSNKSTESMPEAEQIEFTEQEEVQFEDANKETNVIEETGTEKVEVKVPVQQKKTIQNKANEEVNKFQEQEKEVKGIEAETATTVKKKKSTKKSTKKTSADAEDDLLQKTPPAKEIVVDKEIKVRRIGKYIFK